MPAMLRFDTLKFANSLTDAGMDRRQAEALVQGLGEMEASDLATKSDIFEVRAEIAGVKGEIADLRGELRTEIAGVKGEIADLRAELRTEIAGVKGEIALLRGEMFRFLYMHAMGVVGLTAGLTVALIKLLP
jgi:hypothetical protein